MTASDSTDEPARSRASETTGGSEAASGDEPIASSTSRPKTASEPASADEPASSTSRPTTTSEVASVDELVASRKSLPTKPKEVNAEQVDELAGLAMLLREEQVQARVVHYKAELETSPELDAITAQVVAQLDELRAKASRDRPEADSPEVIEAGQAIALETLLARLFRADAPSLLVEHTLKKVTQRITRLFFESELHERLANEGARLKTIAHPEQALYYVLCRYDARMREELSSFAYADDETRELAGDLLQQLTRDLRVSFLSKRSPELKRFLAVFNEVVLAFFQRDMPTALGAFAAEVVVQSGSAHAPGAADHTVPHTAFGAFRRTFERAFLARLVGGIEPMLVSRLTASEEGFREETIAFAQAPEIYTDVCGVVCDAVYDFLCNEGYLDLPVDWRTRLNVT